MTFAIELVGRARRDLDNIYKSIKASESAVAGRWYKGVEATISQLSTSPRLDMITDEDASVRQLIYGHKPHFYSVLYEIDVAQRVVRILPIRHGHRQAFRNLAQE